MWEEQPVRPPPADAVAFVCVGDAPLRYPIRSGVFIGRSSRADVPLESIFVAPAHAVIHEQDGNFWVTNQATNGTELNGERLTSPTRLQHGDRLLFGDEIVTFYLTADAPADHPTGEE